MKKTLLTASSNLLINYYKILLFATTLLAFSTASYGQVNTYSYNETSGVTYTQITGIDLFGANPDEQVTAVGSEIALGFNFNYNGTFYSNIRISANGFITFGGTNTLTGVYGPINSIENYTGAISGYGRNLINSSFGSGAIYSAVTYPSSVEYQLTGTPGSQVFTVQFKNMARYKDLVSPYDGLVNFQIKLFEGTNVVKIIHNTQIASTANLNLLGQTGLRGTNSGTDWVTRLANSVGWTSTTAGAANQGINYRNTSVLTTPHEMTWTPPCSPRLPLVSSITPSGATLSWTAPFVLPLPTGYTYEVRTSGAGGSGATGLVTSGTTTTPTTSVVVTGLSSGVTYSWYVRSSCGTSAWVTGPTFIPTCGTSTIPYFRYFDEGDYTIPAIPQCMSIQNVGTGSNWFTSLSTTASAAEDFYDEHLVYDHQLNPGSSNPANVWFFTPGFTLTAGLTYKLFYEYGGSTDSSIITNKMLVSYGAAASDAGMTVVLYDHDNIKTSLTNNSISFSVSSTGVYYIGFKAYSAANMGRLYLDTIEITEPGCKSPTGLTTSGVTSSSVQANWTAPSPAPGGGYAYYISTSPTTPSYAQLPTGYTAAGVTLATITGLSGSTTYYVWVRSVCGTNDYSQWSAVASFTTLVQPPYCIPAAPADLSTYITNFTTTGGSLNINNSSGFSAGGYGNYTNLVVTQIAGSSINFSVNCIFSGGVGVAIWVDWDNDGTFSNIATPNERVYNSAAYIGVGPITSTITVPIGQLAGSYRMRIMSDYWATSPDPCSFGGGTTRGEGEDYTFTVGPPPPALNLDTISSAQCANVTSPLITISSATIANYDVYTWSPSTGVSGNSAAGYTFNASSTVIYTLTGFNSTTLKTNTVTYTYTANPVPTPIVITPSTSTLCQSEPAVLLTATGGNISGVPVLSENFNTTALGIVPPTGWATTNTSFGGANPANATLTIRPDGYDPNWEPQMHSNDNSQFIFIDADSQGSGGTNVLTMTSPVFGLPSPGYISANLSFSHFYRTWFADTFIGVEISTDGGGAWSTLQSYTLVPQGTSTNFANVNINLNGYIGQTNLRLRFRYNSVYGYGWAIDNILVSGSASTNTIWNNAVSPLAIGQNVPGLYTDAAATTQYVAGTVSNTVYALPTTTTTFMASASTLLPPTCTISQTVGITVIPTLGGIVTPALQNICGGAPGDIVLTGSTGTIQWQYATNLAFTIGVTNIAGATGATLTSAQMGVLAANRYYRAVLTNGSCTVVYSTIASVLIGSTPAVWDGSSWSNGSGPSDTISADFQGDYDSAGDLNACSVTVTSGDVTFYANHSLIVQNAVIVTGGSLSFADKASLVQVNNVTNAPGVYSGGNSGNITYLRTTTPMLYYDYTYWSTPVFAQALTNVSPLTPFGYFFEYNAGINNWQWINSLSVMTPGKGYIIRAPSNFNATGVPTMTRTAPFYGEPNNGDISIPIVGGANQLNLLGNPYPSALSADDFINDLNNSTTLSGTLYFWTHYTPITANNYTGSDYAIYNYMGGVGTGSDATSGSTTVPNGKIASGQGFFVKGLDTGTATFKNSMRIAGNNDQFFKMNTTTSSNGPEKHRYWLDITNTQGAYKQALVGYVDNATMGIDRLFDGEMVDVGNAVTLYTLADITKLSIQGRPLPFDVTDTVPLGYKSTIEGTYTITLTDFDGLFESQNVYLEDTLLNVIHDLKSSPYTFATVTGTFDTRFILRYTTETLGTDNPVFDENTVVVYKNEQGLHINTGTVTMKNVTIFDIRGRQLASQKQIGDTQTVFTTLPTTQQVLLVKIEDLTGGIVTKKVVY